MAMIMNAFDSIIPLFHHQSIRILGSGRSLRLIFSEDPVENNAGCKSNHGKSADSAEYDHKGKCICGIQAEKQYNPVKQEKQNAVWKMANRHQHSIFDCLFGRTYEMRDDREHINKYAGKNPAYDPESNADDRKKHSILRINNVEIHSEDHNSRKKEQPHNRTLFEILSECFPVVLPYIRIFSAEHLQAHVVEGADRSTDCDDGNAAQNENEIQHDQIEHF